MLGDRATILLETLIHEEATAPKGEGNDLTIQPDRGLLFCNFMPTTTPYQVMYRLDGCTAHLLHAHVLPEELPWLTSRLPNLWTRSYYVGPARPVSAETLQRYVAGQKGR